MYVKGKKTITFDMGDGHVERYIVDSISQAIESKYMIIHTTSGKTIGINLEAIVKFVISDSSDAGNAAEFL